MINLGTILETHQRLIPTCRYGNLPSTPRNLRKTKPGLWLSLAYGTSFSKSLHQAKMH